MTLKKASIISRDILTNPLVYLTNIDSHYRLTLKGTEPIVYINHVLNTDNTYFTCMLYIPKLIGLLTYIHAYMNKIRH